MYQLLGWHSATALQLLWPGVCNCDKALAIDGHTSIVKILYNLLSWHAATALQLLWPGSPRGERVSVIDWHAATVKTLLNLNLITMN